MIPFYANFTDATAVYNSQYGRPNKTIHLVNVNCQGTEGSIEECTKTAISLTEGKTIYKNHSVAGVDCHPEPPTPPSCTTMSVPKNGSQCTNGEIQLQNGGSNREGRLVYCHNGLWTPFCYLDERAATVACKQLGFNAYTRKNSNHIILILIFLYIQGVLSLLLENLDLYRTTVFCKTFPVVILHLKQHLEIVMCMKLIVYLCVQELILV